MWVSFFEFQEGCYFMILWFFLWIQCFIFDFDLLACIYSRHNKGI
jgi:hypothetical protein